MYKHLEQRLKALQSLPQSMLTRGRLVGVEKESLRVNANGGIARTDHPRALGAALTNPYITTDYSEALLEFVTPPVANADAALRFLDNAHRFVYPRLSDAELIWATSMPCVVDGSDSIRIGEYGDSNAGKMKHAYRRGLGLRYGKIMQTIAGVHYNFSWSKDFWQAYQSLIGDPLPATTFVTEQYFHMTRNLLRYGWLVPYLFGSSPAICKCFLNGNEPLPGMQVYNNDTYFEPFGTSLRMGDIGYQYAKDAAVPIKVSYSDVKSYVADLLTLITTPHARYSQLGLRDEAGEYQQLNTNNLQIENEYYSSVRPKQIPEGNEMPLLAMARRGIRYLELRSVDVSLFEPLGISSTQLHFLEVFMLFSLLQKSDKFDTSEVDRLSSNMSKTAHFGREPGVKLQSKRGPVVLADWGVELLDRMIGPAELLDQHAGSTRYSEALAAQREKMSNSDLTPSARVIREMHEKHESFYDLAWSWSVKHASNFAEPAADASDVAIFEKATDDSIEKQARIEASDTLSFDDYFANYLTQLSEPELRQRRSAG